MPDTDSRHCFVDAVQQSPELYARVEEVTSKFIRDVVMTQAGEREGGGVLDTQSVQTYVIGAVEPNSLEEFLPREEEQNFCWPQEAVDFPFLMQFLTPEIRRRCQTLRFVPLRREGNRVWVASAPNSNGAEETERCGEVESIVREVCGEVEVGVEVSAAATIENFHDALGFVLSLGIGRPTVYHPGGGLVEPEWFADIDDPEDRRFMERLRGSASTLARNLVWESILVGSNRLARRMLRVVSVICRHGYSWWTGPAYGELLEHYERVAFRLLTVLFRAFYDMRPICPVLCGLHRYYPTLRMLGLKSESARLKELARTIDDYINRVRADHTATIAALRRELEGMQGREEGPAPGVVVFGCSSTVLRSQFVLECLRGNVHADVVLPEGQIMDWVDGGEVEPDFSRLRRGFFWLNSRTFIDALSCVEPSLASERTIAQMDDDVSDSAILLLGAVHELTLDGREYLVVEKGASKLVETFGAKRVRLFIGDVKGLAWPGAEALREGVEQLLRYRIPGGEHLYTAIIASNKTHEFIEKEKGSVVELPPPQTRRLPVEGEGQGDR